MTSRAPKARPEPSKTADDNAVCFPLSHPRRFGRPLHCAEYREILIAISLGGADFFRMPVMWTMIVGLVVGLVAKLLIPGRDPGGLLMTAALGVAGAFIAHLIGRSLGWYSGEEPAGIIASVFGALLLLTLFRLFVRRNRSESGRLR